VVIVRKSKRVRKLCLKIWFRNSMVISKGIRDSKFSFVIAKHDYNI